MVQQRPSGILTTYTVRLFAALRSRPTAVAIAGQGRVGSGAVRDQARAQAAATMPLSNTAAGVGLPVTTMDERLAVMQRQLGITTTQNQAVATRVQQLAASYRGLGGTVDATPPERRAHGTVQAAGFGQKRQAPPSPPESPWEYNVDLTSEIEDYKGGRPGLHAGAITSIDVCGTKLTVASAATSRWAGGPKLFPPGRGAAT
jgi:hypothetical protein